jgi:hypothetical protein
MQHDRQQGLCCIVFYFLNQIYIFQDHINQMYDMDIFVLSNLVLVYEATLLELLFKS